MMSDYRVVVTVQYPAWNERDGITFYVTASSKAEAIKEARCLNERGGQVHSKQGRAVWRSELVESASA
jgi:hypothetical protein